MASERIFKNKVDALVFGHTSKGHEVMVIGGVVTCVTCREDLDDSGARPGLVEENQTR